MGRGRDNFAKLPLRKILKWEPLAARLGVSKVARSARGFLAQLEQYGWRRLPERWVRKRAAFIKRHMAQVRKRAEPLMQSGRPSRRHLALIMWGYSPMKGRI